MLEIIIWFLLELFVFGCCAAGENNPIMGQVAFKRICFISGSSEVLLVLESNIAEKLLFLLVIILPLFSTQKLILERFPIFRF